MELKILHLIDHMGLGGAQKVICALLNRKNHFAHSLRKPEKVTDCQEEYSCSNRKTMFSIKSIIDTYRKVKEEDVDIIQCHMPIAKAVGVILKLIPWLKIKLIFHEHGTIFRRNFFYSRFIRLADLLVYKHITVSNKSRDLLVDTGIEKDKIEVIRNFADIEKFSKDQVENFDLSNYNFRENSQTFKIGYAGRIVQRKGWRTLIKSAKYLENAEIIYAGKGNEVKQLKERIDGKEGIHYLGYIEDVRELLSTIDCIVIPSKWDPNPLIFYESQQAEVPVIASNCKSLNEIAQNGVNSILFEPGNPAELASKIEKIRKNEEIRNEIVSNGKKFADKNSKTQFQERFNEYYKKL